MDIYNTIKVTHLAYSDVLGGAARAAYRLHKSFSVDLNAEQKIISSMRVIKKTTDDFSVKGGVPNNDKLSAFFQRYLNKLSRYIYSKTNYTSTVYSTAWPSTGMARELNRLYKFGKLDILNLHYLSDNTISIKEIGQLKMPIVWRLNDQWPFCGGEHYQDQYTKDGDIFIDDGYINCYINNLSNKYNLINLNKIILQMKKTYWKRKIDIVAPSNWIAECARRSYLFSNFNIHVIPSAINLDTWKPIEKNLSRKILNLPLNKKLILFGALGGTSDLRKGSDLLFKALNLLSASLPAHIKNDIELVIFGQGPPQANVELGFNIHYAGHLNDDVSLCLYYSASDVYVLPSKQDNLPGTAIESHSCGTPVVAFDIGGMSDIISNKITGSLVPPFDAKSLANQIYWTIENNERNNTLSRSARLRAEENWDHKVISNRFSQLYQSILYKGN